jgi:hypothetical protein
MSPTTEALASGLGIKPQTLRAALCRDGHYYGIRPAKLPNGRLLWPADAIERLTTGQAAKPEAEAAPCSN